MEKNGFTHKDAYIVAKGKLTGTASAPVLQIDGTTDQFALTPAAGGVDLASLLGKTVTIAGVLIAGSFLVTYAIAPRLREGEACAADDPTASGKASKLSRMLLWGSAIIWSCGFFVPTCWVPFSKGWPDSRDACDEGQYRSLVTETVNKRAARRLGMVVASSSLYAAHE
jgi:hypothetical protein